MAKASKHYSVADFRLAIEAAGASPSAIGRELNCTRGTVYSYLRRFPELKAAYEAAKGGVVEDKPQFPKEVFEKAIKESRGVKAMVAATVGCSRQTVDNALAKWPELVEMMDAARSSLVSLATSALVEDITDKTSDGHVRAYMFVLKTLGKDEGFVERSEVTGADGAALLDVSPEILQQIKDAGLNVGEVLKNFAAMVQAGAT
jgi:hypothetical protein